MTLQIKLDSVEVWLNLDLMVFSCIFSIGAGIHLFTMQLLFKKENYGSCKILLFIRIGYNMEGRSRQMSVHNAAKSYNMLNAFNAKGEIDYISYPMIGNRFR